MSQLHLAFPKAGNKIHRMLLCPPGIAKTMDIKHNYATGIIHTVKQPIMRKERATKCVDASRLPD